MWQLTAVGHPANAQLTRAASGAQQRELGETCTWAGLAEVRKRKWGTLHESFLMPNHVLRCIKHSITNQSKEGIVPSGTVSQHQA